MAGAFQSSAFQNNAFQVTAVVNGNASGATIIVAVAVIGGIASGEKQRAVAVGRYQPPKPLSISAYAEGQELFVFTQLIPGTASFAYDRQLLDRDLMQIAA